MTVRNRWKAALAGLAIGGLVLGLYLPSAHGAAGDPPTAAQAQAALDAISSAQSTLQAYVNAQSTPTATSTADPLAPAGVTASTSATSAVVTWSAPSGGAPTGYTYGRDGTDSTGAGPWTSPSQTAMSATLDKLVPGTIYHVTITALYAAGGHATTIPVQIPPASSPSATATSTASPTTTQPAGANPSGLSWSSGVWTGQDRAATASFVAGPRGGRPVDNVLVYTTRSSIAAENAPNEWKAALPADFNGVSQDLVLALTTWTADGAFMTGAQGQTIGASVCSVDGTRPIVRLDWEMNLPDGAGANGAMLSASNYSAWVSRFNAVASGLKAGCPGLRIDFNPNHGTDQTSGCNSGSFAAPNTCSRQAFQAVKANVDIYGLDTYDSYPPVTSSGSGWSARTNGSNFGELENSRLYAVANGKGFSVPEWGVACNGSGCQWQGSAGGDDPIYVTDMLTYFAGHTMAYETYFDDPGGYIVSDLISNNPNSRAAYRSAILANAH